MDCNPGGNGVGCSLLRVQGLCWGNCTDTEQKILSSPNGSHSIKSVHRECGSFHFFFIYLSTGNPNKGYEYTPIAEFKDVAPAISSQAMFRSGQMIYGTHVIIYSENAEADRALFRDVLRFPFVDAGRGWLIFALPPAEVAVHPSDESGSQEIYFMCDDIKAEIASLADKNVVCSEIQEARWGSITKMRLPGGREIGLYQPIHQTALGMK